MDFLYHPKTDLVHLFVSGALRKSAVTLLSLFSPVYIFLGVRSSVFDEASAVILTISFYLILYLSKFLTLLVSENLSQRAGFKGTIWISALPFLAFVISLIYSYKYPFLYIVSACLWGIHAAFYWWGYNGYFVKVAEKPRVGETIGQAHLLETIASIITPFLGAIVVAIWGFNYVFIASAILFLSSLLFLGKKHDRRQKHDIKFGQVCNLLVSHKSIVLAYFGVGGEAVLYSVAWPLFLYLFFKEVINLGIIVSLAALIAAIFGIVIGRFVDKYGEKTIMEFGVPLLSVSSLIKFIVRTFSGFVIADSLRNFGERMVEVPLSELSFKKAIEGISSYAIMFREIALLLGAASAILGLSAILYFGGELAGSFILAALLGTFPVIAVFKHKIYDRNN